jgi:hypothetical protein
MHKYRARWRSCSQPRNLSLEIGDRLLLRCDRLSLSGGHLDEWSRMVGREHHRPGLVGLVARFLVLELTPYLVEDQPSPQEGAHAQYRSGCSVLQIASILRYRCARARAQEVHKLDTPSAERWCCDAELCRYLPRRGEAMHAFVDEGT